MRDARLTGAIMASTTSFFPGFAKVLFGRRSVSYRERFLKDVREGSFDSFARLFHKHLPEGRLKSFAAGARNRRSRSYTLSSTFWLFLWQVIHPGASCRSAVQKTDHRGSSRLGEVYEKSKGIESEYECLLSGSCQATSTYALAAGELSRP